jgi:hypothetical protein
MKQYLLGLGLRVLLTLASAVVIVVLSMDAVHSTKDRDEVAKMTKAVKMVCVGRFLIDLPQEAQVSLGGTSIDGFSISTNATETDSAFMTRVARREAELSAQKNQFGKKSLESVQLIDEDGQTGKIFVFGRTSTYGYEGEKKITYSGVSVNAYVRTGAVSFDFIANTYAPDEVGNLRKLITQLRSRANDDIPLEGGFCIDHGFVRDPLGAEQTERAVMFAGLPAHPDLSIAFSTMAGTKSGQGLLERNTAASAEQPAFVRALISTLREGARTINGMPGEELALKVREVNFATTYGFDWEMGGTEHDVLAPFVTLELQAGLNPRTGGKPVQSTLSEAALLELWDKVASSVRIRRTNPPKVVKVEPVPPPLGSKALAGETCPVSGWWQCAEGGKGIGVLGGQRQFMRKDQRMPQALLLPPQTLWQKLRGLQPSYESATPTAWTLMDKRSRARTVSPVPLAQAQLVAGLTADAAGAPPDDAVPAGTFIRTGMACPASGWWRCEEPRALDGARWFARGSLLPPATFRVEPGAFGRRDRPEAIQRRSRWQLMRHAPAPVAALAAADLQADGPGSQQAPA